jgi:hypothetical protein
MGCGELPALPSSLRHGRSADAGGGVNDPWIEASSIERSLRDQATHTAAALGHKMTHWIAVPMNTGTFMSRCITCYEAATIAVRKLRVSPIAGVAVQLRCRPKKK